MMLRRYEKVKSLEVFIITGLGSFRTPAAKFNDRPHLSTTRLHTERDDSRMEREGPLITIHNKRCAICKIFTG